MSLNKKETKAINKVLFNKRECIFWERGNYCRLKLRMGKFAGGINCEGICEAFEAKQKRKENTQ